MEKYVLIIISCFIFSSCIETGYIGYDSKPNEIIPTLAIKEYIKKNQTPSILLRVPKSQGQSSQSDPNSAIYNAIEKELIIGGFNVKDRGLYNEVISKSGEFDYKKLKEITGTDLILELVTYDTNREYATNLYYTVSNNSRTSKSPIIRNGASIEFKLILLQTNEYCGSYSFYYNPCPQNMRNDCKCTIAYKSLLNRTYPYMNLCKTSHESPYQSVDENVIEEFLRKGVKQMIAEIRK